MVCRMHTAPPPDFLNTAALTELRDGLWDMSARMLDENPEANMLDFVQAFRHVAGKVQNPRAARFVRRLLRAAYSALASDTRAMDEPGFNPAQLVAPARALDAVEAAQAFVEAAAVVKSQLGFPTPPELDAADMHALRSAYLEVTGANGTMAELVGAITRGARVRLSVVSAEACEHSDECMHYPERVCAPGKCERPAPAAEAAEALTSHAERYPGAYPGPGIL